jgi:tetratricopeptide (TPR) repeat protein
MGGVWGDVLAAGDDDTVDVSIRIQDESGTPIPHVSVWRAVEVDRDRARNLRSHEHLTIDDLWRVTQRHGALHDIICQVGDKPLATIWVTVMGDADGVFREALDHQEANAVEGRQPRPDPLRFGYTFMKRGYLPGRVAFTVPRVRNQVAAVVTLKRNPGEAQEAPAYLQTFDRLRYEISDLRRNAELTEENRQRLVSVQEQMEQAAQQALAASDKAAAARIHARMRYMPSLQVVDGQIAGWDQGDASTRQARRAMERAYELDPGNLYVWMQTYLRRTALLPHPTTEERVTAAIMELERLIAAHGEAVWPQYFADQAVGHALLGHYEKAYRLYLEAAQREPKYMDWQEEIGNLTAEMKNHGVAIPAR